MKVPFYGRHHGALEYRYMKDCLSSGLETDGFFMHRLLECSNRLFAGARPLFTTSCSSALETIFGSIGLEAGDEVVLPSFNFPSAANGVLLHGGVPVLCDIDPETQNISPEDAARKITSRTKAIVAVHYAGVACEMEQLGRLARQAKVYLIEDAAQGIGAGYGGRPLGTIGDFGAISFHYTKNITCGEGGLMLTPHEEVYRRASQYRLHGTNRAMYLAGEVDRYTWTMTGSCTALGELAAAVLLSQFEALQEVTKRRVSIMEQYRGCLGPLEEKGLLRLMGLPSCGEPNGHILYVRFPDGRIRGQVQRFLLESGVDCKTHYVPLHVSPVGRSLGYKEGDLKESFNCFETLLRLPIHSELEPRQIEYTADMVKKALA